MKNKIQLLKKFVCAAGIVLLTAGGASAQLVLDFTNVDPDTGTVSSGTLTAGQTLGDGEAFTSLSYTVTGLTIDADGVDNDEVTVTMALAGFDADGDATISWDVIEIDHNGGVFNVEGEGISFGTIAVTGVLSGGDALVVNSANYTGVLFRRWAAAVDETVNVDGDVTDIPLNTDSPLVLNDTAFSVTHVSGGSWQVNDFGFTIDVSSGDTGPVLKGDVNLSGDVTFLDINPFIMLLAASGYSPEADCDCDGDLDFLDIQPFIDILAGN